MRLFLFILFAASIHAEIIPAVRTVDWATAGVPSGFITNRTVYTTLFSGDNIQTAINNCPVGQAVQLNAGTYTLTTALTLNKAITLRGSTNAAGQPTSILRYTSAGGNILNLWDSTSEGSKVTLSGSWLRGTTNFTVSSASGLSVGSCIVVCQGYPSFVNPIGANGNGTWEGRNDPTNRVGQIVFVTAVDGNNIGVSRPAYIDYTVAPKYMIYGVLRGVGLEDLVLWRTQYDDSTAYNIYAQHVDSCWVRNVSSTNTEFYHFYFFISSRCTIEHCYIDSSDDDFSHAGDRAYGIHFNDYTSDCLVQNNILKGCRHSVVFQGGVSGTVVGYNYSFAGYNHSSDFIFEDLCTHTAHPFYNLFEGNYCANVQHDNTLGSASHNLTFRTYMLNDSSAITGSRWGDTGWKVMSGSWSNSLVGSVVDKYGEDSETYTLGWWDTGEATPTDTNVAYTAYIHGVYGYKEEAVIWNPNNADHTIPNSMYLDSKPSWFGDRPWPPVDPLNPSQIAGTAYTNLPAGYRLAFGEDPPEGPVAATTRRSVLQGSLSWLGRATLQ